MIDFCLNKAFNRGMNYIQKLEQENKELKNQISAVQTQINDFILFLHGPKFTGTDNGERKDWISTGDTLHFLREMRQNLIN